MKAIIATSGSAITESSIGLVNEWLDWCKDNGAFDATVATHKKSMQVFLGWLRDNPITAGIVTAGDIVRYKGWLAEKYSVQTVNLRLSACRSFYKWMVVTERIPLNPAAEVKGLKRSNSKTHKRDPLSNGEVLAVLDVCRADESLAGVRDLAIITIMAYCGARAIEVQRANMGNLTTQGDRVVLQVQGKGRLEADEILVIPHTQEGLMRHWLSHRVTFADHADDDPLFVSLSNRNRGDRLTTRAIRGIVKSRYHQAGVVGSKKSTHSLRHSAITNAIRQGATPMQVQAMARHGSFDTTLGYYHEVSRVDNPAEDVVNYG